MKHSIYLFLIIAFFSCAAKSQTYKLMTYNIRYDNPNDGENQWSKRKILLCNLITFYEPDIFGIQEGLYHQVKYIDSTLIKYKYIGEGRDDGKEKGEYSAIFYKTKKFKVIKEATFWLSETPDVVSVGWDASMGRICTYALFKDRLTNQHFWVFNTHFDHIGNIARLKSAELIVNKIKELNQDSLPIIITGDFNLKPNSNPIIYLSKNFNDSKTISQTKPFGPTGTFNGFKFHQPITDRIDYIFTSKENISVNKFAILSNSKDCKYPSDHLPVFVELKIK